MNLSYAQLLELSANGASIHIHLGEALLPLPDDLPPSDDSEDHPDESAEETE